MHAGDPAERGTMIELNSLAGLAGYAYLVIFALAAFDVVFPVLPS